MITEESIRRVLDMPGIRSGEDLHKIIPIAQMPDLATAISVTSLCFFEIDPEAGMARLEVAHMDESVRPTNYGQF
jgi:hypothetical protein